jgi:hypothetical protein
MSIKKEILATVILLAIIVTGAFVLLSSGSDNCSGY